MSPGFRSTEWWHAVASSAAGIGLLTFALLKGSDTLAVAGAALIAVSTFAYAHSRGKAKGRPYLPPQSRL